MYTPKDLLAKLFSLFTRGGHGLIKEDISPDDWHFGAIGGEIIRPDGQWTSFLPPDETQNKGVETMNCTCYGTQNAIEILHNAKYGELPDHSERYCGVISGTTPRGNQINKPCETIRKYGCIPEEMLPFDTSVNSWNKYYSPKPMEQKYFDVGKEWLDNYEFLHEWVRNDRKSIMSALKFSPLGVSVDAWRKNSKGYYVKLGPDNHWTCLVGYKENEYWIIRDSYPPYTKKVAWNTTFGWVKRYSLTRAKSKYQADQDFYDKMTGKFVMRVHANGELYKVGEDVLKKVTFNISDQTIWQAVHKTLRPIITGVTEPDFIRLSRVAKNLKGGIVEADPNVELKSYFKE